MEDDLKIITMAHMARNEFSEHGKDNMTCIVVEFKH